MSTTMISLHFHANDVIELRQVSDFLTVQCGPAHIHLHPEAAHRLALALLSQPMVVAVAEAKIYKGYGVQHIGGCATFYTSNGAIVHRCDAGSAICADPFHAEPYTQPAVDTFRKEPSE